MKLIGIGIDILEIDRMQKIIEKGNCSRIFTSLEYEYIMSKHNPAEHAAGIFCAKEAISKAFGTGLTSMRLGDIEILHDSKGKPFTKLFCDKYLVELSISHCMEYACANAVVLER